ncbi:uncharacterized protein F13E9.13, mitochondrial isoform X1 [Schistocerca gregaria]|uniref:uncharacterized protein F13E9.13, mitochondrial isoform X1 n=2 Tax=Schistocerca gregaria TaxID=7010 RepID=UPI00211F39F2|nr:uncharacterized protein F13E9.13, mitochondrial isoform X1 [Schistocerca gregaria]
MQRFHRLFNQKCNVIGMIHVGALPGTVQIRTPNYRGSVSEITENACKDAEIYMKCEVDGVLIENMHDVPYVQPRDMEPETVSLLSCISMQIRNILPPTIQCGVQVLAGGNKEAIAISLAAGLQFVRAEGFVFSHIADEGFTDASAGTLLRYRRKLSADQVLIFADVKKKHSAHAITADISLDETIKAAEFFMSDGVIITGSATGEPVDDDHFKAAKQSAKGPVLIGSGVTAENFKKYMNADGLIVGSHFKKDGRWQNAVDPERVQRFMEKIKQ